MRIHAIDDSGQRRGPVTLSLAASATVNFSSYDLEGGGAGLSGGVGDSTGHWRLELETDLDIEPVAYVRTSDGFLASVHDVIEGASMRWHVVYFNPGSNIDKVSLLRVVNTSGIETEVVIEGRDDAGVSAPGGKVSFTLPAEGARMLSAQDLEGGYSASESAFEFEGSLGDGTGKWQLFVTAGRPVQVMSLLNVKLTGHLANLSTSAIEPDRSPPGFAPVHQPAFDARFVGKRMQFSGDLEYADFVSVGRLIDTDDGGASLFPGTYTYRYGGPDSGVLYVYFDVGVSCPVQVMFDSASTGTITHSCGDEPQETETWQLVEIPATGFAPADQAAFDARVVGKRVLSQHPSYYTDFVSPGRFVENEGTVSYAGRYTYQNTGSNSGRLVLVYDDGDRCTAILTFESATTGTGTYSCTGEPTATTSWRLVDIPSSDAPDLVVESPSVSDSSLDWDETFTLRVTVRNQGDGRSDGTTLRYYSSSDATISAEDREEGTDSVNPLTASGTSTESIELSSGCGLVCRDTSEYLGISSLTRYYGACVDSVSGEGDRRNNCSSGMRVDFSIETGGGGCYVGQLVRSGDSCTYPGTTTEFSVNSSGTGRFLFFSAGRGIRLIDSNINGSLYTFVATNQGGGVWRIDRVGS